MTAYTAPFCPRCGRLLEDLDRPCPFCTGVPVAAAIPPAAGQIDPDVEDGKSPRLGLHPLPAAFLLCSVGLLALDDRGRLLLTTIALSLPAHLVFLLGFVVVGRAWRQAPLAFAIGFAPVAIALRVKSWLILIGALPLGGYVKWKQDPAAETKGLLPAWRHPRISNDVTRLSFSQLHPFIRLCMCLSGPLFGLLLAFALLRTPALGSFQRAFVQAAGALFRSREENMALLRPFIARIQAGNYAYAIGTLAAKNAAISLIPVATNVGQMAVLVLLEWLRGRRIKPGWEAIIQYVGLILAVVYFCVIFRALWELLYQWNR